MGVLGRQSVVMTGYWGVRVLWCAVIGMPGC